MSLLLRARQINAMLQNTHSTTVDYEEMAKTLSNVIQANIFIVNKEGYLPGYAIMQRMENERMNRMLEEHQFPEEYAEGLLNIAETTVNLDINSKHTAFPVESQDLFKTGLTTIVPVVGGGERLATLLLSRLDKVFTDEDLILAEYGATVIGMEILREKSEKRAEEVRSKTVVQMALRSLSFSEQEAIEHILAELDGNAGLVVASKIADRVGITRSVIVNAIRKLQSAGVIESRSLGMKGTHIKVLNEDFLTELAKLKL